MDFTTLTMRTVARYMKSHEASNESCRNERGVLVARLEPCYRWRMAEYSRTGISPAATG